MHAVLPEKSVTGGYAGFNPARGKTTIEAIDSKLKLEHPILALIKLISLCGT